MEIVVWLSVYGFYGLTPSIVGREEDEIAFSTISKNNVCG